MAEPRFKLLITDLDNTLYDWLAFYVPSFLAMVAEIHRITGIDVDKLKRSFRKIHQAHRTTEYAFSIEELDVLKDVDAGLSILQKLQKYDSAIHTFRIMRKRTLTLYPGVKQTLQRLRDESVLLVAHSDSMASYVSRRLRQLEIDTLFSAICAPKDHGIPDSVKPEWVRRSPDEDVIARTRLLEFEPGLRKPNPATLAPVFKAFEVGLEHTLYVGDSRPRDVLLARRSGVTDVWARYGERHDPDLRRELEQITYWTDAEILEDRRLRQEMEGVEPSYTIDSFTELLDICGISDER